MKKLVLIFAAVIFSCLCASAKSIEFTVVSDARIKADASVEFADKMTPSINTLLGAIDMINSSPSEFVVFSGDNINGADKYSLVMFSKIIRKIDTPVYVSVGEKDVAQTKDLDKKEYYRVLNIFSHNKINRLPYAKKIDGFVFLFVDGVNQFIPSQFGYYKENQLMWLDKMLDKYSNDPVIIVQHYPVVAPKELGENKLPHKIEDYKKILEKHNNVISIISGHHNIEDEIEDGGIYHISMPSLLQSGEYKKIAVDYNEKTKKAFIKTRIYKVE